MITEKVPIRFLLFLTLFTIYFWTFCFRLILIDIVPRLILQKNQKTQLDVLVGSLFIRA